MDHSCRTPLVVMDEPESALHTYACSVLREHKARGRFMNPLATLFWRETLNGVVEGLCTYAWCYSCGWQRWKSRWCNLDLEKSWLVAHGRYSHHLVPHYEGWGYPLMTTVFIAYFHLKYCRDPWVTPWQRNKILLLTVEGKEGKRWNQCIFTMFENNWHKIVETSRFPLQH